MPAKSQNHACLITALYFCCFTPPPSPLGNEMPPKDIRRLFEEDGFVGPLNIVTREEAWIALTEVETEIKCSRNRFKLHLVLPSIASIAFHPKLIEAVKEALGSDDIWLWSSDVNIKEPETSNYFAPHQDSTYAGLEPLKECLTAWVALSDPVGENEGCLCFYPGSHNCGQLSHDTKLCEENLLSMGQFISDKELKKLPNEEPILVPLQGGQATLHSFYSVHSSGPNKSCRARIGLALRYMSARVNQTKTVKEMATVISGSHDSSNFDLEPRLPSSPTEEDIKRGRIALEEAIKREAANYFADSVTDRTSYERVTKKANNG